MSGLPAGAAAQPTPFGVSVVGFYGAAASVYNDPRITSHFGNGTITFSFPYLFRTPPGWSMLTMGSPNHVKDGIQALAGVVETDWLPFPFTMNWLFTRPGKVRFEKGEPFCFITLLQDKQL